MQIKLLICCLIPLISILAYSQPYIDLVNTRFLHNPNAALWNSKNPFGHNNYYNFSTTLPFELKKGVDAIILSPYAEKWDVSLEYEDGNIRSFKTGSVILPISLLYKSSSGKWTILTTTIARINAELEKVTDKKHQVGGAALVTRILNNNFNYKFGLYYNREFFGNFFMPLAGLDWKMNDRDNLFGTLPGTLTYEHRISKHFYYGINFKAFTNSYRLDTNDPCFSGDCSGRNYIRIEDNQLGVFGDFYLTKHIVLSTEVGHTVLRKIKNGFNGDKLHIKNTLSTGDNLYLKSSLVYRIRLW
jgi:hypothetical protein